ncbi:MAG: hypothetical protein HKN27_09005 [Silicimonas sp.]|nr:hypothetical protein [Silicimonas sp.]
MKTSGLAAYVLAGAIVVIASHYGIPKSLGAHPFWAITTAWIGAPIGLVLAFTVRAMKWRWATRLLVFIALLAIAGTAAHQGRLIFAASFAENTLAGQFWYLGWIASAAFAAALIASILTPGQIAKT